MLSVTRYQVETSDDDFLALATSALDILSTRPGFVAGRLAQNLDEPTLLTLITEWEQVGDYRRALGNPEVKMVVLPLLYRCLDEPSAYADVRAVHAGGAVRTLSSDLAPE